jgi:hypothetical protein
MAHEEYPEIGKWTWRLDPRALIYAQNRYDKLGDAVFVMYASTNYSFIKLRNSLRPSKRRAARTALGRFLVIRVEIAQHLRQRLRHPLPKIKKWVNDVETLSAHAEFLSRWPELSEEERKAFGSLAEEAITTGIAAAAGEAATEHNLPLFQLSYAQYKLSRGEHPSQVRELLRQAYVRAPTVRVQEQKRRAIKCAVAASRVPIEKSKGQEP